MNRRSFLASIPFLPAAVKAALTPSSARFVWFVDWSDIAIGTEKTLGPQLLTAHWMQATRLTSATSLEYEDAIDQMFEKDLVKLRANFSARRLPRFKDKLARQLATPAPNLP